MRDLSLHLLDIIQNSLRAGASAIEIVVEEAVTQNNLRLEIKDNGKGMSKELLNHVTDPFVTSRTNRKVGLGISLLKQRCEMCGGELLIKSQLGEGTNLTATMQYNHIDRVPLGNIAETLITLILSRKEVEYKYKHIYEENSFLFSTTEIKEVLEGVSIQNLEVIAWLTSYLETNITQISCHKN